MKTLQDLKNSFIESAERLEQKSYEEKNELKSKDMNGMSKGFKSAANELNQYIENNSKKISGAKIIFEVDDFNIKF